jgi:ketosteroid isomerase-like protein
VVDSWSHQRDDLTRRPTVHPFRAAVEARDLDALLALLAEDVVFRSPVVFRPYEGRDAVTPILRAVLEVFEDFRYVREIGADDAADHALVFETSVAGRQLEGCDFLHVGADGLVSEFTVMVRPLSATLALAEAMRARLEAGTE